MKVWEDRIIIIIKGSKREEGCLNPVGALSSGAQGIAFVPPRHPTDLQRGVQNPVYAFQPGPFLDQEPKERIIVHSHTHHSGSLPGSRPRWWPGLLFPVRIRIGVGFGAPTVQSVCTSCSPDPVQVQNVRPCSRRRFEQRVDPVPSLWKCYHVSDGRRLAQDGHQPIEACLRNSVLVCTLHVLRARMRRAFECRWNGILERPNKRAHERSASARLRAKQLV